MSEIPDKVIRHSVYRAAEATNEPWWEGEGRQEVEVAIRAMIPLIAAWARQQERERIGRALNEADAALAAADDDERAYWEGHVHALVSILNQEGEQ